MKQIKITEELKAELDRLKFDKETYNLVIHRLIRENGELKINYDRMYEIALNLSKKQ